MTIRRLDGSMHNRTNDDGLLAGKEGVYNQSSSDCLIDRRSDIDSLDEPKIDESKINDCIQMFASLTPFEFDDKMFVASTRNLSGEEFAQAVYRVYLRRKCEHQKIDYGAGTLMRLNAIAGCRRSGEFNHIWAREIDAIKRRNPIRYFFDRLWIKLTG